MTEETIFLQALEKRPDELRTFLDSACAGDTTLRQRVEVLLRAHRAPSDFLDEPAPSVEACAAFNGESHSLSEDIGAEVGPYRLVQKLGEGGMGVVFKAEQSHPVRRTVALKITRPGMDSQAIIARFEAERQALALMDHPNIAKVLDVGTIEAHGSQPVGLARPYFVMELVEGVPITNYCDDHSYAPRQLLELFIPVCQAVQHAHQKGIIHRDLKPSNVLVTQYDGKPVAKVIDFGIAKATGKGLTENSLHTQVGAVIGTLQYMSPEQAGLDQIDVDTRSDVYSLGVMLFELLTRSTPLESKRVKETPPFELLRLIREEEPTRPSIRLRQNQLQGVIPADLDWIVMKCLEKSRDRRYATANDLAVDLERFLRDEPVSACPPSRGYRVKKFVRRNRVAVIAAACVLVALVAGIVGTSVGLVQANRESSAKQKALDDLENEQAITQTALTAETAARNQAMTALRTLSDGLVVRLMGRQVTLTPEDRNFLKRIVGEYEKFATIRGDGKESRTIRAEGNMRVGILRRQLGEFADSLECLERARDQYLELATDFANESVYRRQLAACHQNIGRSLRDVGRSSDAVTELDRGITLFQHLATEAPDDADHRRDLARCRGSLAESLMSMNKLEEAEGEYRKTLALLTALTAESPDDAESRSLQAGNHHNLAIVLRRTGKRAEAHSEDVAAHRIFDRLVADFPSVPDYRNNLANSHVSLGIHFFEVKQPKEAELEYRAALQLWKQLTSDFPTVLDYRRGLATAHGDFAAKLVAVGMRPEAAAEYGAAITIWKQVVADFPKVPEYRSALAVTYNKLANMHLGMKKLVEADAEYKESIALGGRLVAEFPSVGEYARDLGGSYCNRGNLLRASGKAAEAIDSYAKAIETLEPLARTKPAVPQAQEFLYNSYFGRANARFDLKKWSESLSDYDRATALQDGSQTFILRRQRAFCLARVDPRKAVAEAEELCRIEPIPTTMFYIAAAIYALSAEHSEVSAERELYAARAVALLRIAEQRGFFATSTNIEFLKKNTAFQILATREDFRTLLSDLEEKSSK